MKIQYVSDLHLEFRPDKIDFLPVTGDILVLAGDICVIGEEKMYKVFYQFISLCCSRYQKVIHVAGNHEFWSSEGITYKQIIKTLSNMSVTFQNYIFLNDSCYKMTFNKKEYLFVGATLWSNVSQENKQKLAHMMNDFRMMNVMGKVKRKFSVDDMLKLHNRSVRFLIKVLNSTLKDFRDAFGFSRPKNIILITHHSPIIYKTGKMREKKLDPLGYETDVLPLLCLKNVLYTFHGHVHYFNEEKVENTVVCSNPRGYPYERTDFNPEAVKIV